MALMARRKFKSAFIEHFVPEAFASGFAVQEWEDWVRLVAWADDVEDVDGGAARAVRRVSASLVIPRSALPQLVEALRASMGYRMDGPRRHS